MKLKKFPQSCCVLTSKSGKKLLIDPGTIDFNEEFLKDFEDVDAILVTHRHSDHCGAEIIKRLNKKVYSSSEVQKYNADLNINVVKAGDKFSIVDFDIEVTQAVHGFLPKMKYNGGEILENIGFLISCDNVALYVTSDTVCFKNDYKADYLFAPATGCGVTMSAYETAFLAKDIGAKLAIICHQDNTKLFSKTTDYIKKMMDENQVPFIIPEYGEEIELK